MFWGSVSLENHLHDIRFTFIIPELTENQRKFGKLTQIKNSIRCKELLVEKNQTSEGTVLQS